MKKQNNNSSWYFLIIAILMYFILYFIKADIFFSAIKYFGNIFINILPALFIVFILMIISNIYFTPEVVIKHLTKKGIKKWIYIILAGVFSTGPIYVWYPLLSDLRKKGLGYGLIACFLYNRAIKIPLLSIAIYYFDVKYITILVIVMIFASLIQGIIMERINFDNNKISQ